MGTTSIILHQFKTQATQDPIRNSVAQLIYNQNYCLPLTNSFNRNMSLQLNNALNAIENSKLSLQQVIQNQYTSDKVSQSTEMTLWHLQKQPMMGLRQKCKQPKQIQRKTVQKSNTCLDIPSTWTNSSSRHWSKSSCKKCWCKIKSKLPNSHEVTHSCFLQA